RTDLVANAVVAEEVADLVVKRRAELRDADPPALEIGHTAHARVVQVLPDDDGGEPVIGPLAALVGDDPHLLAAEHDVVGGRGEPGGADVDLAGRHRRRDRRRGLEVDELRLHAELLEESLLDADEDGRRGRELEDADPGSILGVRVAGARKDGEHDENSDATPHHPLLVSDSIVPSSFCSYRPPRMMASAGPAYTR